MSENKSRRQFYLSNIYFLFLVVNIISGEAGWEVLSYATKPILMPVLLLWFSNKGNILDKPWLFFTMGIFFGWWGDIFLLDQSGKFFLLGLASFLIGHIFYIVGFHALTKGKNVQLWTKYAALGIALLVYIGVSLIIFPAMNVSEKKPILPPVLFYSAVICLMAWYSWFAWQVKGPMLMYSFIGAILFLFSDFSIALNYFVLPNGLNHSHLIIMSTYGLAQFLIVYGIYTLKKSHVVS